jgi:23S rRNA (cytosine1962-C5)-methyltransferase
MYQLLDTGNFQKLEQVGPFRLVRPAAQAVWRPRLPASAWNDVDASFTRFSGGDGKWTVKNRRLPESWRIDAPFGQLVIRLTDFGHLGIFPEQHRNWGLLADAVRAHKAKAPEKELQVLNLFAYTGGSTLAAAGAGAHTVHVDASKTSVTWARENADASGLGDRPVRWIVDDVQKFVQREARRNSQYHGIILDPPSYGRGPKGETWKIEEMLPPLLDDLKAILAPDFAFFLLSGHSAGYTPLALGNLLGQILDMQAKDAEITAEEMTVRESDGSRLLPSGASCLYVRKA